ncbi:MAG: DnaJ domain-containing protein [Proteobacteria bacterium]|nr:DnaJ domain-containing protein [Pseudomonadota bacterium]
MSATKNKNFLTFFKKYPIATVLSGALLTFLGSYLFTWPSLALLQYAIGFKTGLTQAQVALLAIQYVSGFSFWGHLAFALGTVGFISFVITRVIQNLIFIAELTMKFVDFSIRGNNDLEDKVAVRNIMELMNGDEPPKPGYFIKTLKRNIRTKDELYLRNLENKFKEAFSLEEGVNIAVKDFCDSILSQLTHKSYERAILILASQPERKIQFLRLLEQDVKERYVDVVKPAVIEVFTKYAQDKGKHLIGMQTINKLLSQKLTPYQVLQLDQNATNAQVHAAFRKGSLVYHSDKNKNTSLMWDNILNAKSLLLDSDCRRNLDKILKDNNIIVHNTIIPTGTDEDKPKQLDNNPQVVSNVTSQEPKIQKTISPYLQAKINKYLSKEIEVLKNKRRSLKKQRNILLNTFGVVEGHVFQERLDTAISDKSIPTDANGHVIESQDEKTIPVFEILNLKTQLLYLKEAQTKNIPVNKLIKDYPSSLDYHALVGKQKVKIG